MEYLNKMYEVDVTNDFGDIFTLEVVAVSASDAKIQVSEHGYRNIVDIRSILI
jgi:hypothetical protein